MPIEGFTLAELEAIPLEHLDALVRETPLVLRVGTSEVPLQVGVLPTLAAAFLAYARRAGRREVEWLVQAMRCANPNPALRAVLERRGFALAVDESRRRASSPAAGRVTLRLVQARARAKARTLALSLSLLPLPLHCPDERARISRGEAPSVSDVSRSSP